jgi:hypothetical protein
MRVLLGRFTGTRMLAWPGVGGAGRAGKERSAAPRALGVSLIRCPSLAGWANFCRAYVAAKYRAATRTVWVTD